MTVSNRELQAQFGSLGAPSEGAQKLQSFTNLVDVIMQVQAQDAVNKQRKRQLDLERQTTLRQIEVANANMTLQRNKLKQDQAEFAAEKPQREADVARTKATTKSIGEKTAIDRKTKRAASIDKNIQSSMTDFFDRSKGRPTESKAKILQETIAEHERVTGEDYFVSQEFSDQVEAATGVRLIGGPVVETEPDIKTEPATDESLIKLEGSLPAANQAEGDTANSGQFVIKNGKWTIAGESTKETFIDSSGFNF